MRALRFAVVALGVGAIMAIGTVFATVQISPPAKTLQASQPASFDHSNCQYPDRWSNPANGCDNSDPAVPECIKAFSTKEGEDQCIAEFVKQHEPPVVDEPIIEMEGK